VKIDARRVRQNARSRAPAQAIPLRVLLFNPTALEIELRPARIYRASRVHARSRFERTKGRAIAERTENRRGVR